MAQYTIRNKTRGRVNIPAPVCRSIEHGQVIVVDVPAHLMEQFDYRFRQHPITGLIVRGAIDVSSDVDIDTPTSIQVPTIDMVKRLIGSGSAFKFGQMVYVGPDAPAGTNIPGGSFFDLTQAGLVFFDPDPTKQNCRVFLNGVLQVNGDSGTPNDVRLGDFPVVGDLKFGVTDLVLRAGDVICVEANV